MKLPKIHYRTHLTEAFYGLSIAILYSFFIYAEHYDFSVTWLNTLSITIAIYLFLIAPKRVILYSGGFIGLLWFYWIGYSFEYYHVGWMTPLITLFFVILYTLFFGVMALTKIPAIRAVLLFSLSFIEPMGWNWMQVTLPLINTYFGLALWQFALILLSLTLIATLHIPLRYLSLLILLFAVDYSNPTYPLANLKIKLYTTTIAQEDKWQLKNQSRIVLDNLRAINSAIEEGYDLIILPESAFPLFLNSSKGLQNQLKYYSKKINIVTGALHVENDLHYNVSYFFHHGEVEVAKKMILVPFGEYVPLPKFIRGWVNETFFDGASDFVTASKPTDFVINSITFRNAICYEATSKEIYEDNPRYIIATSNNGWFYPSIEPTLQKLLMRYYATKSHSVIYHSANQGGSGIITGR